MAARLARLARWYLDRSVRSDAKALPPAKRADGSNGVGRWVNPRSGLGSYQDKAPGGTFVQPVALDRTTLDSLYEFDAMTGRIVDREPNDAIRKGIELVGFDEATKPAVEREIKRLRVLEEIANARRWSRLHGGGALILAVDDGAEPSEPINLPNLRALRGVYSADRWDVTPTQWDTDPGSPTFGEPLAFFVGDSAHGTSPVVVHRDRIIRFFGVELPPRVAIQREGWGASIVDRVWTALRNWSVSHEYAATIVGEFTQGVYKLKGLAEILDSDDGELIAARLEVVRMAQSIIGHIALDAEGEGFEKLTTNVAGLRDLLDAFVNALVAVTEMPRTILLGEQPAGLGASADSEIRVWYDHVASQQTTIFGPPLRRVLNLLLAGVNGPTGGVIPEGELFEWRPLWEPNEDERSKTRLANAQARASDLVNGVISSDEARREPEVVELYSLTDDEFDPELDDPELEAPEVVAPEADVEVEDERIEAIEAPPPNETLEDAKSIGRRLGVGPASIVGMHRRNEIRAWKIGGRWRFAYSDVLKAAQRSIEGLG